MDQANDTGIDPMALMQSSSSMSGAISDFGGMANDHNQQQDEKKESSGLDTALKVGKMGKMALTVLAL